MTTRSPEAAAQAINAQAAEITALRAALDQTNQAMFDAGKIYGELILENQKLRERIATLELMYER